MKAVVLDGFTLNPGDLTWEGISSFCSKWDYYDRTDSEHIVSRCVGAQIVLTNKVPFTRSTLNQLPELKCILVMATGYNVIDLSAAQDLGISVYNVPAYSTEEVAQHVFAMILHITNRVADTSRDVQSGGWEKSLDFSYMPFPIRSISGLTLGLIGYGSIAKRVCAIALAFNMKVLVANRSKISNIKEGTQQVDYKTLCHESDFISLHIPENKETRNIVNSDFLHECKAATWIINTARGGLINESDLLSAVQNNMIAGAFLDVLVEEPMKKDHPFRSQEKILLTPHVAWAADKARARCMNTLQKNIHSFLNGLDINRVA